MTTNTGDNEVVNSRTLTFSREQVFKAWISPEQLARWWGPQGFSSTFQEFEPKPGGEWRFVMHGPDGTDYPNHSMFEEIIPYERIVLKHLNAPHFRITATFEEAESKTLLTFRQTFEQTSFVKQNREFLTSANEQNLDRLEALLAELAV